MGSTKYEWTDKTKTGLSKEEFDALWAEINAIPTSYALDDISDVTITSVADNEVLAYDSGGDWINQTAAEAGLATSGHDHDADYSAIGHDHDADYAALVHTHTLLADRTVVSLTPGAAIHDAGITHVIGGGNTDVGVLQFPDAATNNAVWHFARPTDWDSGQIRITWYWSNMAGSVSGVHHFAQRLTGWADGEDFGAINGNTLISGGTDITGLSNQGEIGTHVLDDSGVVTLSDEDFFAYRIQRQGSHGSDTSTAPWHIALLTFELIAI